MADEVTPRRLMYGFLILLFVVISGVSYLSYFTVDSTFDGGDKVGEFNRTFNKLSDVQENINSMESSIEDSDPSWGVFGVLNALINSVWQGVKLLFSSWSFVDIIFAGSSKIFGVPVYMVTIAGLFVSVTLIFAVWKLIFQTE